MKKFPYADLKKWKRCLKLSENKLLKKIKMITLNNNSMHNIMFSLCLILAHFSLSSMERSRTIAPSEPPPFEWETTLTARPYSLNMQRSSARTLRSNSLNCSYDGRLEWIVWGSLGLCILALPPAAPAITGSIVAFSAPSASTLLAYSSISLLGKALVTLGTSLPVTFCLVIPEVP